MAIKDFIPSFKKATEEYEEIRVEEEPEQVNKLGVRIEKLGGMDDVDRIIRYVKNGFVVFLKTQQLQKRQPGQFQTSILKIKRLCKNYGFDLVGTEEGYLILAPKFVEIER